MAKTDTTSAAGSSPAAEQDMTAAINAAVEEALRAQAEENEKKMEDALEKQAKENEKKVAEAVEAALAENHVGASGQNPIGSAKADATEMVKIKISRERKDQGDVEVSVNGRVWQIKRGVEVEVPAYVAEVLENTRKMDELRMERIESATKNFS